MTCRRRNHDRATRTHPERCAAYWAIRDLVEEIVTTLGRRRAPRERSRAGQLMTAARDIHALARAMPLCSRGTLQPPRTIGVTRLGLRRIIGFIQMYASIYTDGE